MTVDEAAGISVSELINIGEFDCACGKTHSCGTAHVIIESGAVLRLPELLDELHCKRPFILSGHDSFAAAGERVCAALSGAGVSFARYVFPVSPVKPTEQTVGGALMHFDYGCDAIIGVGSGVINDTCKMLARALGKPYIIVATAPSMDGFASATSSMDRDGLKVSLDSTFAWAIVGDLDILCEAPMRMLAAGVGDMLAKYISLAEWRIAHILVGEYYCPVVASLVDSSLKRVAAASDMLLLRDKGAVREVMEGMVIAGMAMKYAGLSRPASGMEHYFSHIWDMRALAFENARADLHGIQCAIGTLLSLKVYEYIKAVTPDRGRALSYVSRFDADSWNSELRAFIGPGAEAMISAEALEHKYSAAKHAERLDVIIDRWDDIMSIVGALPSYEAVYALAAKLGIPDSPEYLGYAPEDTVKTFATTKDIRDKYIGSRLLWDLGLLEESCEVLRV